jgi:signal transduction histidine kinase/CheY-like chemotaxis protein
MQRLSIARSLRLALVGLTLLLALVAALGVASLYGARQRYETTLARASQLATATANLTTAGIAEVEVWRDVRGSGAGRARRVIASEYASDAAVALRLARGDAPSRRLLRAQTGAQARARQLVTAHRSAAVSAVSGALLRVRQAAAALQARQLTREDAARERARSDSRRAIVLVIVAGVLALVGALALITFLVAGMRRPLDALVLATRDLASGQLERRVSPDGPRELQELGTAFNAMGDELSEAQRRLELQRHRLAVTVESLGDALLVTAPGADQVATVNPRAAELVPELTVGVATDGPDSPLPPLAEALAGERVIEHRGRTLAITAAALGESGDGVVWTVRDISERARLERAKSDFVATASHELRSPLTSIKGFVELLANQSDGMSARQREFVDIILRSTDRLVELVGDLLDVARIDADSVEIDRRPIDVAEAVHEVAELMGPRLEEKHQQLDISLPPTLPLALADAQRVRQIVANLLTNAHLYTPERGRISIGARAEHAWVEIVVSDTGIGMDEQDLTHVFERFFRASGEGRKSPGTGLGLSIVKSLVDMQEGEIDVESAPGRGTTFRVRLPAAASDPVATRELEAIRGSRVLVVDDEPEVARLIADQLGGLEVSVTVAGGGEEALARLRGEHFDVVTLDVSMPGLDGLEVLRRLRDDPQLRSLPVVFVSVSSTRRELAGEWVVAKPIDAGELRNVLDAAVRAGRTRVLVVAREELRRELAPALDALGIEHEWKLTGAAAARACEERRFEVALVDTGIRNPQAVLRALDLRGRRLRRAVVLMADSATPPPAGLQRLGLDVVPVQAAAQALLGTLRGTGRAAAPSAGEQ